MGSIIAICTSAGKGTAKTPVDVAILEMGRGISGDAHAGDGNRQISILPLERIEEFRKAGAEDLVEPGCFGENLVVSGIDFSTLQIGSRLKLGNHVLLEITQFGKECHDKCRIGQKMGECIMPTYGVFAKVLAGGTLRPGDSVRPDRVHRVGVLTVSDSCSQGKREDLSGKTLEDILTRCKFTTLSARAIVPDDATAIETALRQMADAGKMRMIITTGGSGFSHRDVTPEATMRVIERVVPGLPEAMRHRGQAADERAILTRAVAGIRGDCLIVNFPGSPKAVTESWDAIALALEHGLDVLAGDATECGEPVKKD